MTAVISQSAKDSIISRSNSPLKLGVGQYIAAMIEANMFDIASMGGEVPYNPTHEKQSYGAMVADAAQSLAVGFEDNNLKDQKCSNLPHHLQTSILTRDNKNLFDQPNMTNSIDDSHDDDNHCDSQQAYGINLHSNTSAHDGQVWCNANDSISGMANGWSMSSLMAPSHHSDMSLNHMHAGPSMLFDGTSAASAFLNDSTPSSTEPIWQRRMHARNQSHQTQEYDQVLLAILADSQNSMGLHAPPPPDSAFTSLDKTKRTSLGYPSVAHDSTSNLPSTMSPPQMQWSTASMSTSGANNIPFHNSQHLQRNSSGSQSSGNISSQTPESSLLNQHLSSFPTPLSASPVEPASVKFGSAQQWDLPNLDQSEESEEEQPKKGSKTRKREDNGIQRKARRQSRAAVSPRTIPVSLSKPKSARSSNEDVPEDVREARKNSEGTSSSIPKGVIDKVVVSKGSGVDGSVIQTETIEGGETRHLCPQPGCDKHFSTSGHARRHSRIHASLRPFECPHHGCGATFTRRDNCTQHQRARHGRQLTAKRISDEVVPLSVAQETS